MITFKSVESSRTAEVERDVVSGMVVISLSDSDSRIIALDPADAPAIALAVMEAGQPEKQDSAPSSADYAYNEAINWLITARDRRGEETAGAARDKRRDELALEVSAGYMATTYSGCSGPTRAAIDRIVELEEAAQC